MCSGRRMRWLGTGDPFAVGYIVRWSFMADQTIDVSSTNTHNQNRIISPAQRHRNQYISRVHSIGRLYVKLPILSNCFLRTNTLKEGIHEEVVIMQISGGICYCEILEEYCATFRMMRVYKQSFTQVMTIIAICDASHPLRHWRRNVYQSTVNKTWLTVGEEIICWYRKFRKFKASSRRLDDSQGNILNW